MANALKVLNCSTKKGRAVFQQPYSNVAGTAKDSPDSTCGVIVVDIPLTLSWSSSNLDFFTQGAFSVLRREHPVEFFNGNPVRSFQLVSTLECWVGHAKGDRGAFRAAPPSVSPPGPNVFSANLTLRKQASRRNPGSLIATALVLARSAPSSFQGNLARAKCRTRKFLLTAGATKQFHARNLNTRVLG